MSKEAGDDFKDDSDVVDQIAKKYFSEIEHSVPHMQQVLFDLQNECYKTWKNAVSTSISLNKEFLDNSGIDYEVSDVMRSLVGTVGEEALKYREYCRKIVLANIGFAKQNAKALNDNSEMFADLNRKTMRFYMSAFFPKGN